MQLSEIITYAVYAAGLLHGGGLTIMGRVNASQFHTPSGVAAASFNSYLPVGRVVNDAMCASGEITQSGLIPTSLYAY